MGALYGYYSSNQMKLLGSQVELASQGVELAGVDYLKSLTADDYRVTLIDSDGSVEFDSAADSAQMENHLERKEIKDALKNGEGQATRYSSTLMERQLYSAKRLSDGRVLRLSCSQYTWWTLFCGYARAGGGRLLRGGRSVAFPRVPTFQKNCGAAQQNGF